MTMKVYSIGYEYTGAQAYVKEKLSNLGVLLIDTRKVPYTWRADWTREALQKDYPAQYHWAGAYLGNEHYNIPGAPIKIVNPALGIKGLIMYLREGHDLILLCKCQDYAVCHRRVIAELLREQMPEVEIEVYRPVTLAPIVAEQSKLFAEPVVWKDI